MVKIFVELIISKRRTFAEVPDNLKDAVSAELANRGYDTNGNSLAD